TLNATAPTHPMWARLPSTFTTKTPLAVGVGPRDPNASLVATEDAPDAGVLRQPAVLVKDGPGRIAQTTIATNYADENALAGDPNVKGLYLDMTAWVAHCDD